MNVITKILFFIAISTTALAKAPELTEKTKRYHQLLMKRPYSAPIFQRFQSAFLSTNDEAALLSFLKDQAKSEGSAENQLLANYLLQKGQTTDALAAYDASIKKQPNDPQARLARAQCYAKIFNFEKAIIDIDHALQHTEDEELILSANKNKGRYLLRSGQTDLALAHWQKIAKTYHDDEDLLEDVIDIQLNDGLLEPALKLATSLRDKTSDPYKKAIRTLRIGDILKRNGQSDKAVETYLEALAVSGSGSWLEREIIAQVQKLYQSDDNITGLTATLGKLSEKYPQRLLIQQKYADTLASQDDFDKAKAIYQKILNTNPQNTEIRIAYLSILKQAGDLKTAQEILDFLIQKNPSDLQLILHKASICNEAKDRKTLLETLNLYRSKATKSPASSLKYATLLQKYNFKNETAAAFDNATKEHPESLENAFVAATYFNTHEQKPKALNLWKTIAEKSDKTTIVRLLDTLLLNNQKELAANIVDQQHAKFKTHAPFIRSAAIVSQANEQHEKAVSFSRDLILLSPKTSELDRALSIAVDVITKAKLQTEVLRDLKKKTSLGIPETCLLIELLETNGDIKATDSLLADLIKTQSPVALLQATRIYERRLQLDKAAASLEQLTKLPQQAKTSFLRRLAQIYERAGEVEKAQATIDRWKTLAPNDKLAWLAESSLLEQYKGSEAALLSLRRGISQFENDTEMQARLAGLYSSAYRHTEASAIYWELYDKAEKLSDRVRWANMLAVEAEREGTSEALVDNFNTRRRKSPKAIAPIMALAEIHRSLSNYEQRRDLLLEATRLRPEDPAILLEIAIADEQQGEIKKSLDILKKAKFLDKTGAAARRIAKIHMDEGNIELGLAELNDLSKDDPRNAESITLTLIKQQEYEEAAKYLKTHLPNYPQDWRLKFLSAIIDYELGYNGKSLATSITLLKNNNEIPNLKLGWGEKDLNRNRMTMGFEALPQQTKLLISSRIAKQYLKSLTANSNQYSYNYYSSGRGSNNSANLLPKEISGLKTFTKLHILNLLAEASDKQKLAWTNKAKQAGFKDITIWQKFHASTRNPAQFSKFVLEEIKKDPTQGDLIILNMALNFMNGNLYMQKEALDATKQYFTKNDQPKLFKELLPFFYTDTTTLTANVKTTNARIAKLENISDNAFLGIFLSNQNYFQTIFQGNTATKVDPNLTTIFKKYITQNEEKNKSPNNTNIQNAFQNATPSKQMYAMAQYYLSILITTSDDIPAIIEEIEKKNGVTQMNMSYGGSNRNQKLTLSFPPEQLTHIGPGSIKFIASSPANFSPEKLTPHLSAIKSPLLKAIALQYTGKTKEALAALEKLRTDPAYTADAELTRASILHSSKDKDFPSIITALDAARSSSMHSSQRNSIDELIVNTTIDAGESIKLTEQTLPLVQASARRLMINKKITSPEQISATITALKMEKEKDRFLTSNKKSIRTNSPKKGGLVGMRTYRSSSNQDATKKKIDTALKANNKKRAAKLIAQKIRTTLKSQNQEYELRNIERLITQSGLQKEVLAEVRPASSTSPRRWLTYFRTAKLTKDKKASTEAINFLKNLPNPPVSVRSSIALAIFEKEPKRAIELLKTSRDVTGVFNLITQKLNNLREKPTDYIPLMELAADYMETVDKSIFTTDYNAIQTTSYLTSTILSTNGWSDNKLNEYWQTPTKLTTQKKSHQERDRAITKYLTLTLQHLPNQTTAFQALHSRQSYRKEPLDNLLPLAISTLTTPPVNSGYSGHTSYGGSEESYKKAPTPIDFILTTAYQKKDKSIITPELIKKIKLSNQGQAIQLEELNKLILLDEKAFTQYIATPTEGNIVNDIITREKILTIRGVKNKLPNAQTVLKMLQNEKNLNSLTKPQVPNRFSGNRAKTFNKAINEIIHFSAKHKPEDLKNCLNKLISTIPENKRNDAGAWLSAKFNTRFYGGSKVSATSIIDKIMSNALMNLSAHSVITPIANKHNIPLALFHQMTNSFFSSDNQIPEANVMIESVKQSQFLTSFDKLTFHELKQFDINKLKLDQKAQQFVNQFNQYRNQQRAKQPTLVDIQLFTSTIAARKNYSRDRKKIETLQKFLNKNKSFGAALLSVLIEQNSSKTLNFIKKFKPEIEKSSEQKRKTLALVLNIANNAELASQLTSAKLDSLFPGIKDLNKTFMEKEIKEFLALTPNTQGQNGYEHPQKVANLVQATISDNPELATKITLHYIKLVEALSNNNSSYYFGSSMNPAQVALNQRLIYKLVKTLSPYDYTQLIYLLNQSPRAYELGITDSLKKYNFQNFLNARATPKNLKPLKDSIRNLVNKIYASKDEKLIEFHKLAWLYYLHYGNSYYGKIKANMLKKIAKQLIRENSEYKEFYAHIILAIDFSYSNLSSSVNNILLEERMPNYRYNRPFHKSIQSRMVNLAQSFSLKNKLLLSDFYARQVNSRGLQTSSEMHKVMIDSLATCAEDPELSISSNCRYLCFYFGQFQLQISQENTQKVALIGCKILENQLNQMKKGATIHKNFFRSTCILAGKTDESTKVLKDIISKNKANFMGCVSAAKILTRNGDIQLAKSLFESPQNILPDLSKVAFDKRLESNFEKLLKEIQSQDKRLLISMHFLTSRDPILYNQLPKQLYPERMLRLAKTLKQSKLPITDPLARDIYSHLTNSRNVRILPYIKNYLEAEQFQTDIEYSIKNNSNYHTYNHLREMQIKLILSQDPQKYLKLINEVIVRCNNEAKQKNSIEYLIHYYSISAFSYLTEIYYSGDKAEMQKMLIVAKELAKIKANGYRLPNKPKKLTRYNTLYSDYNLIYKLLCSELGKEQEYRDFIKSLTPKAKRTLFKVSATTKNKIAGTFYNLMEYRCANDSREYRNASPMMLLPFLQKAFDTKSVQDQILKNPGFTGLLNTMIVDYRVYPQEAIDLYKHLKIETTNPLLKLKIVADKAMLHSKAKNKKEALTYLNEVEKLIKEQKLNKAAASEFILPVANCYLSFGEKEKARSIIPTDFEQHLRKALVKEYRNLQKRLK